MPKAGPRHISPRKRKKRRLNGFQRRRAAGLSRWYPKDKGSR